MIDIALLRVIKNREQFDKVYKYIPLSAIDKRTKAITKDIKKYYDLHPDDTSLDMSAFRSLFFTAWHTSFDKEATEFFNKVLDNMATDASEAVTKSLINMLLELEFATDAANLIDRYQAEEEVELIAEVTSLCDKMKQNLERTNTFAYAQVDAELMEEEDSGGGYTWPLACMQTTVRNLRPGDAVIVAARPDAGKTSFLTFNIAHFAPQSELPIIWLNNESKKERILRRAMQSAVQCTNKEMLELQRAGTLFSKYEAAMGGLHKLRVYDIHGWDVHKVEDLIASIGQVGIVVFDMLDNVRFPSIKGDARTDQVLEAQYQWWRELAVHTDSAVLATSQISTDGSGLQFPELHMLKDSKTGKQGACDAIIMLGKDNDPLKESSRFISLPKNKLKLEGVAPLREEILFDADKGIYLGY